MDNIFSLDNFNIFSDNDNYYFFRALNLADNKDLDDIHEKGKIIKIRTNLDRYENIPIYTKNDEISLEQMVNHIKMHQRKDTNCISLTSNANTALTYGRGNYNDKYVMIKVSKESINKDVFQAGLYMLKEIENIISEYYENGILDEKQKYYIDRINNARTQEDLELIKSEINIENVYNSDDFWQKGLDFSVTTSKNFNSLNEKQNFAKNKTIMKIDVLNKKIINTINNKFLIQTIGNAFSSLELIHYKEISADKITYMSKELVDIFGLVQQLPSNLEYLDELKKELLEKAQLIRLNGEFKYKDFSVVEDELTLDKMYELTNGQTDYKTAYTMYKKSFYLCKSKLRTENSINLLNKIVDNNPNYSKIIEYMRKNTYGIEPEITTRVSKDLINVSESVSLDFSSNERELFNFINSLDTVNSQKVLNYPVETIKVLLDEFMFENDFCSQLTKEEWYANSIIDMLDLSRLDITEKLSNDQRRDIINKLLEYDFIKKYDELKIKGYDNKTSIDLLFTSLIRNTNKVSKNDLFTLEELEDFIGYNKIKDTNFELRTYQKPVVDEIDRIFGNKKFASAVLPTGAGKSFVALAEMYKYKDEEILYLAPNNEILDQIKRYIKKFYRPEEHIGDHIDDVIKKKFPNLTLATYQILKEESAKDIIDKKYSLIVFDELHRTGASEWSKKVNELVDNQNDNVKVLGITATPERDVDLQNMTNYWASKLGYTEEEIDMEEHMAANMDIITAMESGYICHPKVVCCEYSLIADGTFDEMKFKIDELNDPKLKKELDYSYEKSRKSVEKADGIEKILASNLDDNGKYIIFLPVTRKQNGTFEDEDGNNISKTEASKIIKDYQTLMNQYLYSSEFFEQYGNSMYEIYEKILSNNELDKKDLEFLNKEKNNILLLSSINIISKPQALNTKNEMIADTIIDYLNWNKLEKKVMKKQLSKIMKDKVENLSMLGSYSVNKNRQNLTSFNQKTNGKKKFMFVMNKLNEGVHVEDVDGIVWLRPLDENSKILYLQQLGRCIFSITNNDYKRPTVIDLVNNTLKVDFEKGLTDIDKDVIKISTIEQWVKTHNRIPIRNSEDKIEKEFAEDLNLLNKKYIKFVDENAIIALPKENRIKTKKIIEIGTNIDLWNMETWVVPVDRKLKSQESFLSFLEINAISKDFLELKNKIKSEMDDFDKISDYIEKLNNRYIPISYDPDNTFSNGKKINYFWHDNKEKIIQELMTNLKYGVGYEIAKSTIENLSFDKMSDYIEKLNNGYKPKHQDPKNFFSNGEKINSYWNSHKEKIIEELMTNSKYGVGYEIAKSTIENLSFDKISDYIEKLNNGYKPQKKDQENTFSNGEIINQFFGNNKEKIIEELMTNPKYKVGYEIAKSTIENLSFDKISDYIEKLNNGYKPEYIDPKNFFSNGERINGFFGNHKEKIIEELKNNPKYGVGYETAKLAVLFDKKSDYIEKLNNRYKPKYSDPKSTFSNGEKINSYWSDHKEKIIEELMTNPKYKVGYEIAKSTIENLSFDKISDYIEKLNNGYKPKFDDSKNTFSNGEKIKTYWDDHKEKIIEELMTNSKYETGYETAKSIVNEKINKSKKLKEIFGQMKQEFTEVSKFEEQNSKAKNKENSNARQIS